MPTDSARAPIALFVYKRPVHTLRTLESLSRNAGAQESSLHVYCDAARDARDRPLVDEVRRVVRSRKWCGDMHVIERDSNQGLAKSIIAGVTDLVDRFGSVIVVEDDLLLAPHFLDFMNDGLRLYRHATRVLQISGYIFPARVPTELDACFLPLCSSWGWAIWDRAWRHFDPLMKGYDAVANDPFQRRRFDLDDSFGFFGMLEQQRSGRIDSWGVRWYLSAFLQDGLTLFPTRSLVHNIGFDGTGTHCGTSQFFDADIHPHRLARFPEQVGLSRPAYEALKTHFRSGRPPTGMLADLKRLVKRTIGYRRSA